MWDVIKTMQSENPHHNFTIFVDTDVSVISCNITGETVEVYSDCDVIISCPACPEGNFSSPYLKQLGDNLTKLND